MMDRVPVREAAQGRWPGILPSFGFDQRALSGRHGPCPMCGGTDRFRFDNKDGRGTWICSNCGAGDGVALVMAKTGLGFQAAAVRIEELVGCAPLVASKPPRSDESARAIMNRLWRSGQPVSDGDPVALWLTKRVGLFAYPRCLRTAAWTRYQHADEPLSHHPAMLAMVTDPSGKPCQLHRTYLTKTGEKAAVAAPRLLMPASLPPGSAVRLFESAETMGVAEGIETALSAASIFGMPVWAALTADNLAKWVPPQVALNVTVFGDNDVKFGGQAYGNLLAHRLACRDFAVNVKFPEGSGQDWNDVLLESRNAA